MPVILENREVIQNSTTYPQSGSIRSKDKAFNNSLPNISAISITKLNKNSNDNATTIALTKNIIYVPYR